ncbi:prepilin-type N-terminal cleavage/methylation domain-containing protein [Candidatus Saccharibacteria bacterium]|nr:MAG: prepilin-type N-terminal cleavage/methylation domain-containing protein [Candidatus Saccharibacteria bacterium]
MTQNINTKNRGFTIVELLIVIVVIAILAAITIVAYNGIQNRARASAGQAAANTVIKKAEAANAVAQVYPVQPADTAANDKLGFDNQSDSTLSGSGVTFAAITAGTAPASNNTIEYLPCTTPSGAGAKVSYYDPTQSVTANTKVTKIIGNTCTTYGSALSGGPY